MSAFSWLDKFKKEAPEASELVKGFFDLISGDSYNMEYYEDILHSWGGMDESFIKFTETTDRSSYSLENYQKHLQVTSKTASTFATTVKGVAATVGTVAANMAIFAAISWGIGKAVSVISDLIRADEIAIDKADGLLASLESNSQAINKNIKSVKSLKSSFDTLSQGIGDHGNNIALTNEEYSEYKKIVEELVDLNPSIVQGYNSEGQAIIDNNTALTETVELLERKRQLELKKATSSESLTTIGTGASAKKKELLGSYGVNFWNGDYKLDTVRGQATRFGMEAAKIFNSDTIKVFDNYVDKEAIGNKVGSAFLQSDEVMKAFSENTEQILNDANIDLLSDDASALKEYIEEWKNLNDQLKNIDTLYIDETIQKIPLLTDGYDNLTHSQKNFVSDFIRNSFSSSDLEENSTAVRTTIERLISDVSGNTDLQNAINNLFALNPSSMPADDYISKYKELAENIITSLNLSDADAAKIRFSLEVEIQDEEELKSSIKAKLDELNLEDINDIIGSLSAADLKIFSSILFEGQYSSFEEAYTAYISSKKKIEEEAINARLELDLEKQNESIDNFQKSMSTLQKALSDTSSLTSSDLIDLRQEFHDFPWDEYGVTGKQGVGNLTEAFKALIQQQYTSLPLQLQQNKGIKDLYEQSLNASSGMESLSASFSSLESSHNLIEKTKDEMNNLKYISTNTLNDIISKYPELETLVSEYNAGLIGTADVLTALESAYQSDYKIYQQYSIGKLMESEKFYNGIVSGLDPLVKESAKAYQIDFDNYTNLSEAKLDIEKKHELKKIVLAKARARLNGLMLNDDPAQLVDQKQLNLANRTVAMLEEDLVKIENIINAIDTSLDVELKGYQPPTVNISNNTDPKDTKFFNQIDWASQSTNRLQDEYKQLETTLNNTTIFDDQVKGFKELIGKQGELRQAYKETAKLYKNQYNKSLSGLTPEEKEKYSKLIEEGKTFSLEDFDGISGGRQEEVYNIVTKAQKHYDSMKDMKQAAKEAEYEIRKLAEQMANLDWDNATKKNEKLTDTIKLLDAQYENTDSAEDKNKILDQIISNEKKSLENYEYAFNQINSKKKNAFDSISVENRKNKKGTVTFESGAKISTKGVIDPEQIANIRIYNEYIDEAKKKEDELALSREQFTSKQVATNSKKFDNTNAEIDKSIKSMNALLSEIDTASGFVDEDSIEQLVLLQSGYQQAANTSKLLQEEIEKLQDQFNKGKISAEDYSERLADLENQNINAAGSMKKYYNEIINVMKKRYNDELELSDKALKKKLDDLETEKKAVLDALDDQLKAYKKYTDDRKKELTKEKDEDNYQEQVAEHNKVISDYQTRIARLNKAAEDGDRNAIKERNDLEEKLAEEKENLSKLQTDRELELKLNALDDEQSKYEDYMNSQKENTEKLYKTRAEDAQKDFDKKKENMESLFARESELILQAAELTKTSFSDAFAAINSVLEQYGLFASNDLKELINKSTQQNIVDIADKGNQVRNILGAKSDANKHNDTSNLSGLNKYVSSIGYGILSKEKMVQLAQALGLSNINSTSMVGTDDVGRKNKNLIMEELKKIKSSGAYFAEGGRARLSIGGNSAFSNLIGKHGLGFIEPGEAILTEIQANSIERLAQNVPYIDSLLNSVMPNLNNKPGAVVNINLPANTTINSSDINNWRKYKEEMVDTIKREIYKGSVSPTR